tara:strand:+ start:348 stop:1259 length:912 start_codon:yes stop_codon:yes gene_type:complete
MNIAIYQTVNAHAPAIHWWLAQDKRFGPQLYQGLNPVHEDEHIGSIVQEIRNEEIDADVYDIHQESLREMENKEAVNGIVDCTSSYFNFARKYEYPVWSNYFGATKESAVTIDCDKLLFAKSTTNNDAMFYITQYAFNKLTINEVNDHSRIWWEDHKLIAGKVLDNWKEIWYRDYHDQCIQDFHNGKLQYMWQLNFAHWDLHNMLLENKSKFTLDYSIERLFEEKHKTDDIDRQQITIKSMTDNNVDHLLVDIEWFNNTSAILDYLSLSNSETLIQTALLYGERYTEVINAYDKLFNKYYKGN